MAHLEYTSEGEVKRILLDDAPVRYLSDTGYVLRPVPELTSDTHVAVYRSKRYVVLLNLGHQSLYVNQCKVALFKIIREGDQLTIGQHDYTFRELIKEVLDADSTLVRQKKRCLVDGTPFRPGDIVVYCPSCNTPHHEPCWQYQKGRCANGAVCQYQAPWAEPEPQSG